MLKLGPSKHHQRHTKPHVCDVPNCSRKGKGFSTTNDLDRHRRSLHPDLYGGSGYYCDIGQCRAKEKGWPRADNFRSHLKRMHKREVTTDDDIEVYYKDKGSVKDNRPTRIRP